ncbi:dipeptide/oligopeptide/nickel ABC transporter permease/ATP-binding protein [Streptomyces sp. NPDC051018]|uniref:dipeptide/oligopeptide/nickel ABC transporter permease/ATP-binding protein n=1 Tax=Streptomyces sp. NPDC051018 TaxID=3365639 RepID=UPI0037B154E3
MTHTITAAPPAAGRKRAGTWQLTAAAVIVAGLVLIMLAPTLIGDAATRAVPSEARQGPSAAHLLGTDNLGRDVLLQTLAAGRLSLALAVGAALLGAVAGFTTGALASVLPGRSRNLLMRGIDVAISFPPLVLALLLTTIIGVGAQAVVLAVGLALAPGFARTAATLALSIGGREFVTASKLLRVPAYRVVLRHIVPNMSATLVILGSVAISNALIAVSGLSFLGIGVQPPSADWGRMLTQGLDQMFTQPTLPLGPVTAILLTGIGISFVGERLAERLDPLRRSGSTARPVPRPAPPRDAPEPPRSAVLAVRGLSVSFLTDGGRVPVLHDIDLTLVRGDSLGIVGESGSGKSTLALAAAGLLPSNAELTAAELRFNGHDLLTRDGGPDPRTVEMSFVSQNPATAFNPALRLGRQLTESVRHHRKVSRSAATAQAVDKLDEVEITEPALRLRQYPHQLSGGMRQRALLAMGLMGRPSVLLADEPTTALDVVVQAGVLNLIRELQERYELSLVLISHDVSVVAQVCRRVAVMYRGRVVEEGPTAEVLAHPRHPYTKALIAAVPTLDMDIDADLPGIPGPDGTGPDGTRPGTEARDPSDTDTPSGPDGAPGGREDGAPVPGPASGGCPYRAICPDATARCADREPVLHPAGAPHRVACLAVEPSAAVNAATPAKARDPR